MLDAKITTTLAEYSRMVQKMRTLKEENDKLKAFMDYIMEAAVESQTRSRVYSKREEAPIEKRIHRGYGKPLSGGNSGRLLRGDETIPVGGVQVSVLGSTKYRPVLPKITGKTKPAAAKMAGKSA